MNLFPKAGLGQDNTLYVSRFENHVKEKLGLELRYVNRIKNFKKTRHKFYKIFSIGINFTKFFQL
jgi:hypothetical protein